jgi:hypothetical protein
MLQRCDTESIALVGDDGEAGGSEDREVWREEGDMPNKQNHIGGTI